LDFFLLDQQKQQGRPRTGSRRRMAPSACLARHLTRCMCANSPSLVFWRPSLSPCSLRSPFSPSLSFCRSVSRPPCPSRLRRIHRMHRRCSLLYTFSTPMEHAAAFLRPRRFADRAAAARAALQVWPPMEASWPCYRWPARVELVPAAGAAYPSALPPLPPATLAA